MISAQMATADAASVRTVKDAGPLSWSNLAYLYIEVFKYKMHIIRNCDEENSLRCWRVHLL